MKYFVYARLFPALLTAIPFILFYYFSIGTEVAKFFSFTWHVTLATNIAVSSAVIYGLTQINRFLSKEIFQRLYFKDEIYMPTTMYLLWKDDFFPEGIKTKIRRKIEHECDIELWSKNMEEKDELGARKVIIFAVSQMRKKLKGNRMLLQHNIEYGFVRNFIGGSVVAFLISVVDIYFFKYWRINGIAFNISIALGFVYLLAIVLSKVIIQRFGHYYAKILFEQYLDVT